MMQFIEARDGFIKFEVEEKIPLSSFVEVVCSEKTYIAQVTQIKRGGNIAIAYAKILFLYDDSLIDYDKSLPNKVLQIKKLSFDTVSNTFHHKTPITAGKYICEGANIVLDERFFNNSMFICIDNVESKNTLLSSLQKQSANTNKTFIIDTTGKINGDKYIAGTDFKIPLNTEALEFLYEDCLNEATSDSKLMIKSIFQELAEYSKTVDFLPFSALKTIIDDMVEKAHVFKLIVLKNKLAKYNRLGYFASTKDEASKLEQILSSKSATIDLSKLEPLFLNRYFSSIYKIFKTKEYTIKVFIETSNNLNKNNLKEIITNKKIDSVFVTNSKFKYIKDIKSMFTNFIIEPSFATIEIFSSYKTFLTSMPQNTLLVDGELTNKIPLVFIPEDYVENELLNEISISENEPVVDKEIPNNDSIEGKNVVIIDETVEEDETAQAITAKSEQLIEKVAQDIEPLNSGLMVNIFTENNENQEEKNIDGNEDVSEIASFENEQEFHTEVNSVSDTIYINSEEDDTLEQKVDNKSDDDENNPVKENEIIEVEERNAIAEDEIELNIIAQNEEDVIDSVSDFDSNVAATEVAPEELNDDSMLMEFDDTIPELSESIETKEESKPSDNEQVEFHAEELPEETSVLSEEILDEDIEKEIVADVDSIFTSAKDEIISDSDLDFIDELNSEILTDDETLDNETELIDETTELPNEKFEVLEELQDETEEIADFDEPIQELNEQIPQNSTEDGTLQTKEATTPIVPVYSAEIPQEDMVMSDEVYQGDTVMHTKYGTGVVEKMIKYGTKTLYSINFDNVGRRLLDPALTEIKKV